MIARYALIVCLAICTLVVGVKCVRIGMGNAFYAQADLYLKEWDKIGKVSNQDDYLHSLDSINRALEYDPNNPHYYNSKAAILDWGILSTFEPVETNQQLQALYLASVAIRPKWPASWIALAAVRSYTFGVDSITLQYMDNAFKYGPFDKEVIRISLSILLSNWHTLKTSEKNRFYEILKLASKNVVVFSKVLNQAKQLELHNLICLQVRYHKDYKQYQGSWVDKKFC